MMNRRELIAASGALAASTALPAAPAFAKMPFAKAQAPGFYRRMVGSFEVTAVLDGDLALEPKLFSGAPDEMKRVAERSRATVPVRSHVNAFAVNTGERLYLIDTGTGALMGASLGRATANMVLAGIDPEQVDAIFLTHLHADHFGGMIVQGKTVFPNADVFVAEADAKFWLGMEMADKAPADAKPYFEMARNTMKPYAHRLKPLPAKGEVAPGIEPIALPGHTVGHSGYIINSGKDRLLIWGDLVHNIALQLPRPDWTLIYDTDQTQAAATRKRTLDMVATDRVLIAGMHLPFPGIGYIERAGNEFRFHPDFWRANL